MSCKVAQRALVISTFDVETVWNVNRGICSYPTSENIEVFVVAVEITAMTN